MATLYMIPCPIVEGNTASIPRDTLDQLRKLDHFIVERVRTARRFIAKIQHPIAIDNMSFFELNKRTDIKELEQYCDKLDQGISIGMISEAGCPGVADPGALAVNIAYAKGHQVKPLVGPSSILMALMASGMSGQQFTFHGYLPQKKEQLVPSLKKLEANAARKGSSEIFMETPYKNHFLLELILAQLPEHSYLHISCNIDAADAYHKTQKIKDWKAEKNLELHKKPAIFILGKCENNS